MNPHIHPTTKEVNRRQVELSNQAKIEALNWLSQTFPEAFNTEHRVRPLKKGIMDDIFAYLDDKPECDFSRSKLREAVVMFTRRMEYLVCLKCRNNRIDLQGKFTGEVSEEEAENAVEKIKIYTSDGYEKNKQAHRHLVREPRKAAFEPKQNPQTFTAPAHPPQMVSDNGLASAVSTPDIKTQVTIKRKIAKKIDPEAVARMKAKLGIAKDDKSKETA